MNRLAHLLPIAALLIASCASQVDAPPQAQATPQVEIGSDKLLAADPPDKPIAVGKNDEAVKKLLAENDRLRAELDHLSRQDAEKPKPAAKRREIVLLKSTLQVEKFSDELQMITGLVENRTGSTLKYVSITFNVLDKNGVQIENAIDETTNLAAGALWKFKALTGKSVPDFKCSEIYSTDDWPWRIE